VFNNRFKYTKRLAQLIAKVQKKNIMKFLVSFRI
jgi:hypothetical protein